MAELRIQVVEIALGLRLTLHPELFAQRFPLAPQELGGALADQVAAYAWAHQLNYFPALEFFQGRDEVDQELLGQALEMGHFACDWSMVEIRRRVTHAFSRLGIRNLHCHAFSLPRARPRQPNGHDLLARHYAPDVVRAELLASSLERQIYPGIERMAQHKVSRWLRDSFSAVEFTLAQRLAP